jgi:hypothetical protein
VKDTLNIGSGVDSTTKVTCPSAAHEPTPLSVTRSTTTSRNFAPKPFDIRLHVGAPNRNLQRVTELAVSGHVGALAALAGLAATALQTIMGTAMTTHARGATTHPPIEPSAITVQCRDWLKRAPGEHCLARRRNRRVQIWSPGRTNVVESNKPRTCQKQHNRDGHGDRQACRR